MVNDPLMKALLLLGGSFHLVNLVNSHGDRKSPIPGVMGPLPNGLYKWLINGSY